MRPNHVEGAPEPAITRTTAHVAARGGFFPTNPDLANILGRTDLDSEHFHFLDLLDPKFLDFQVPRFPKSGLGRAWALGQWLLQQNG